jgi:hypothetical protein
VGLGNLASIGLNKSRKKGLSFDGKILSLPTQISKEASKIFYG